MLQGRFAGIATIGLARGPFNDPRTGRTIRHAGMGIVVDQRHVLTGAHVVNAALGHPDEATPQPGEDEKVPILFPLVGDDTSTPEAGDPGGQGPPAGQVVAWRPMGEKPVGDIAVLALDAEVPTAVGIAAFARPGLDLDDHPLQVFGIRAGSEAGNHVDSVFTGPTTAPGWR
jgi:hypothetical protein